MPRPPKSLQGQRIGALVVLSMLERNKHGNSRWLCRCDCGKLVPVWYQHLKTKKSKSCGCRIKPVE